MNAARNARKQAEEEAEQLRNQIALLQRKKEKEEKRIEEEQRKAKEVVEILSMHHENFGQKHEVYCNPAVGARGRARDGQSDMRSV